MYMGKYSQLGKKWFVKFFNLVTVGEFILNLVGTKLDFTFSNFICAHDFKISVSLQGKAGYKHICNLSGMILQRMSR